jgi:hypothetical protein
MVPWFSNHYRGRKQVRIEWYSYNSTILQAENFLATQSVGTYLVRFSTTSPGAYAISSGESIWTEYLM